MCEYKWGVIYVADFALVESRDVQDKNLSRRLVEGNGGCVRMVTLRFSLSRGDCSICYSVNNLRPDNHSG